MLSASQFQVSLSARSSEPAGLTLPDPLLRQLASRYDHLPAFPDAGPALRQLSGLGFELAVLSNGTPGMIRRCLDSSGLQIIGQALSVHAVRAYKPSPRVYQYAARQLGRPAGQLRLVSGNACDIAGAGAAGLRTAWVNRAAVPFDTIGLPPEQR
jgi:2-haloacid dehalogenase